MKHRNVCYLYNQSKHYIAGEQMCSAFIFYIWSLTHVMYKAHNKATLMVSEIMKPITRNSKISTINTTSNLSIKHRGIKGNTHICLIFISYKQYSTTYFDKCL